MHKEKLFGVDQRPQEILVALFWAGALLQEFTTESEFVRSEGGTRQPEKVAER